MEPNVKSVLGRVLVACVVAGIIGIFPSASAPSPPLTPSDAEKTILVLSDTQAPLFWETLILPWDRNEEARQKIMFTAKAVQEWLGRIGVRTLFIESGSQGENDYVESFISKLRDELLNGEIFDTLLEARWYDERGRVTQPKRKLLFYRAR